MALGSFQSPFRDPTVAMYPILCYYNSTERVVLPFIFAVRKFFDHEVQVPMGFLTRPVTGYETHDDARAHEHGHDHQCCLHHINVPFNLPSIMLITTAKQNMPVSM